MPVRRAEYLERVRTVLRRNPVCTLLGPRQCGKTTLARQFISRRKNVHFFDLETAVGRAQLSQPETVLTPLRGLVVIDEIQQQPDLFRVLRPLVDRPGPPARFLLLGSASPQLVRGVSESLAGRTGFIDMSGFDAAEVGAGHSRKLWLRGGLPRSYLARSEADSFSWREDFIRTLVERDLPQLGVRIPPVTLNRFWTMTR